MWWSHRVRPLSKGVAVLLLVAGLFACGDDRVSVQGVEEPAEVPARDAVLVDGAWEEAAAWIRRENAEDRPVVMNILASWCGPCERELPLLLDAYDDNPDIAFLGIDHLDNRENAQRFVEEQGIRFPTLFDLGGEVAAAVEARGMPTTVVFDTDGTAVAHHTGELTPASLDEMLDAVR